MKSLKRTLSLVLVLVMVLGLVGISAGASFKDEDKINYKEAVGVMTGIGALVGYPDGTFNGTGTVTREEAVKTVVYAVLGADVAKTLAGTATGFADVDAGRWSSGVIAYAVSRGIINGRDAKTFDPTGNVTANEVGKMMLCAAGYGAKGEFIGSSWELNTAVLANKLGMFAGSKATNNSAPATREETALYTFNGLTQVKQVSYSKLLDTYVSNKGSDAAATTIGTDVYKLKEVVGIVTGNASTGEKGTKIDTATVVDGKITTLANSPSLYTVATDRSAIGQVVKVYYRENDLKTVYGVTPLSTTINVAKAINTDATAFKATFGDVTSDAAAVYNFTANYAAATKDTAITGFTDKATAAIGTYAIFGGEVVSYIAAGTTSFEKVMAVNPTNLVLSASGTKALTSVNAYTGIAKGDMVLVSKAGEVFTIEKAKTVEGQVTSYSAKDNALTINGVAYPQSANPAYSNTFISDGVADVTAINFKSNTTKLYLNAAGAYVAAEAVAGTATASNIVLAMSNFEKTVVTDYGNVTTNYVQTVAMDGTVKDYKVASELAALTAPTVYKVVKVDAAGNYTLTPFVAAAATAKTEGYRALAANTTFKPTTTKVELATDGNAYVTAATQFVFTSDKAPTNSVKYLSDLVVSVSKGYISQTLTTTNAHAIYGLDADGNKVIKTIFIASAAATVQSDMLYATSATSVGANALGNLYQVYSATTGEKMTINSTNAPTAASFHTYAKDANGVYTLAAQTTNEHTFVSKFGNKITTSGTSALTDADASSAIVVDTRTDAQIKTSGIPAITSVSQFTKYVKFNAVTKASDNTVSMIFVTAPTAAPTGLVPATYAEGKLTCTPAATFDGYSLTYQWYKNVAASTTVTTKDATEVVGAIGKTHTLTGDDNYYFCVVTVNGTTLTTGTTFTSAAAVQAPKAVS